MKKITIRRTKLLVAVAVLVLGAGTGATAATVTDATEACCYPGSVMYYDNAGTLVGVRMFGCGDPGWGITTRRSRTVNGCVM